MTPSMAPVLRLARIVGGLAIFSLGWYLTSDTENTAAVIAMGVATASTIGGAYAASLMLDAPSPSDTAQTSFPVPAPAIPTPAGQTSQDEALADLLGLLRRGVAVPSQDWLTQRWGLRKGTVSRWITKWENQKVIKRTRVDGCNIIST